MNMSNLQFEICNDQIAMNPFCTRRIRPGALQYLFPAGTNAEVLDRAAAGKRLAGGDRRPARFGQIDPLGPASACPRASRPAAGVDRTPRRRAPLAAGLEDRHSCLSREEQTFLSVKGGQTFLSVKRTQPHRAVKISLDRQECLSSYRRDGQECLSSFCRGLSWWTATSN